MTAAAPASCDDVTVRVDVVFVGQFFITVRDRITRRQHSFRYDEYSVRLGSSPSGDCYELTLPRSLADDRGIGDV